MTALRVTLAWVIVGAVFLPTAARGGPGGPQAGAPGQPPQGTANPPASVLNNPDYFEKLKKQAAEQKAKADDNLSKTRRAAQQHIDAQAQARGGPDQVRRQLGATLADLNARLPNPAGQASPADATPGPRIEPGMRLDVILKNGGTEYSGTLVGVDGTKVLLQTVPLPGAKPSEFELSNIEAFHTSDGIFAYNPRIRKLVPALTYYSFNNATGNFERMPTGSGDAFLAENAKIVGGTNSATALFGVAQDGSWSVGLPLPYSDSPQAIPAANFQKIITAEGVYTYDARAKNFTYTTHAQIAQAAQQQQDAAGQAYYKQEWDHNMQKYQLTTERVRAMQPVYSSLWSGGPPPWYLQQQQPPPPQK